MSKCISGWHVTGKSTLVNNLKSAGTKVASFDERDFDVVVVRALLDDGYVVVLPTTPRIHESLKTAGIEYDLVYPDPSIDPQEFLPALVRSGRRMLNVHNLLRDWSNDVQKLTAYKACCHITLGKDQFLSDIHGKQK